MLVTPCVGVWIETVIRQRNNVKSWVTPCVGVWIETLKGVQTGFYRGHTLRGCVDWNIPESIELMISISHTLRGCVDWNTRTGWILYFRMCHTLRGCVDWNFIRMIHNNQQEGHTLRGCVDWNLRITDISSCTRKSHPAWVCGLKLNVGKILNGKNVTPCVGVWIETRNPPLS